jgi:hypothetical protein
MMKTMLDFALAGWECATGAVAAAQIDTNPTQPMRRKDSLVNIAASLPGVHLDGKSHVHASQQPLRCA